MNTLEQFSLKGRTALVTGSSYGLGVRFAKVLAGAGANIVLTARSMDKLKTIAAEVEYLGVKALPIKCDVTVPSQVAATVGQAWEEFGRIDILVNNAGVIAEAGVMPERTTDALFAQTMATNVNGSFSFCREIGARQLADGGGGSIINIASAAGLAAQCHFPTAYQASKAAIINLTRNLAASWGKRGVRVNALAPGWFESELTAPFFAIPLYLKRAKASAPMGRHGAVHELDGAILFLASDASSFMTGATLVVDGGLSATNGEVDYSDELFAAIKDVAGELATPIRASH